jgi:hypothetical protein
MLVENTGKICLSVGVTVPSAGPGWNKKAEEDTISLALLKPGKPVLQPSGIGTPGFLALGLVTSPGPSRMVNLPPQASVALQPVDLD